MVLGGVKFAKNKVKKLKIIIKEKTCYFSNLTKLYLTIKNLP